MAKYSENLKWWQTNDDSKATVKIGNDFDSSVWRITVNNVGMSFARIPPGRFRMGVRPCRQKEQTGPANAAYSWLTLAPDHMAPAKRVEITRPFWMMQSQVSIEMFDAFCKATKRNVAAGAIGYNASTKKLEYDSKFNYLNPGFPDIKEQKSNVTMPATCVDWATAVAFCDWLNEEFKEWRSTNALYRLCFRLPTEAEWEYACRAGSRKAYFFGNDEKDLPSYGNYDDGNIGANVGSDGSKFLAQNSDYRPNKWQLFNMCGNVWEWCADWYGPYEKTRWFGVEKDPSGPGRGMLRVVRGGAWNVAPSFCRSASRAAAHPWVRAVDVGFRVAMDLTLAQ